MAIAPRQRSDHIGQVPKKVHDITPPHLQAEMRAERIGERLRLLRETLGYKPSEIADELGIERTYWSRFEKGHRPISEAAAVLLVDRFGVTLDWLILGRWESLPFELASRMRRVQEQREIESEAPAAK